MPPCEQWIAVLDAAADGEPLPEAARQHVGSCVECGAYLRLLIAATKNLALLPYDDPGPGFTTWVMRHAAFRRRRPFWAATAAVLLAGGAGSSAGLACALVAAASLWFGPARVVSTAGHMVGEVASALLSGAQSVIYSGAMPITVAACAAAAVCLTSLMAVRTLVGARRATLV